MEYRMKCNVCGKIFCYTDEDLKENSDHAKTQTIAALGALAATLGGTTLQTHHLAGQANRHASKIVDYTQCPHCHSRSISVYTGDDTAQAVTNTPTATIKNINTSAPTESLLKRAFLFLEDEEWETADAYCEACLDKDPELAEAYLGKLMAELHVKTQTELKDLEKPFDDNRYYIKILRFANDELKNTLSDYIAQIHNRNEENARKDDILCKAKSMMNSDRIFEQEDAIVLLTSIAGWKDADELRNTCHQKLANLRKKADEDREECECLTKLKDQGVKGRIIIHAPDVNMGICHFHIYLGKEKVASIERGDAISIDIDKDSKLQVSVGPNLKSSPYWVKSNMLTELDFSMNRLTWKCTPIVRRIIELGEAKDTPEETTSAGKECQIQTNSHSNTIVVLEKKEQSPATKFLRLSIVRILKAIAYFLYGIAILGGIVYITEKAFLDCFICVSVLGGSGWFCHSIARKICGDTPKREKEQEPKKQKIMIISAALIVILLFAFSHGGTDSAIKEQLCDGVWCKQLSFKGSSFTTVDFGPWLDTSVYEFKPNNTFTAYFGTYYFSDMGSLLNVPMEVSYSGKYSIDEDRCQIKLISPDGGETKEIPYAINEYTHELMFDVNSSGKTSYWHEDSLEDGLAWYDMVH